MRRGNVYQESKYRPCVRVGNWFEELCREQQKIEKFRHQRENNELLVEKTRTLFDNFTKEVELSAPRTGFHFGCILQLIPIYMNVCEGEMRDILPALSVVITERVLHHSQEISDECEMTVAPSPSPTVRNSFRLVSANGRHLNDEPLKYGDYFRLECLNTSETIYLCCAPVGSDMVPMIKTSFETHKCGQFNLPVGLVKKSDIGPGKMMPAAYANWFCQHVNASLRFEHEGIPVTPEESVVITHQATNKNLAATSANIQTLFGQEFLICAQNFTDTFNRTLWQNVWKFNNGHNIQPKSKGVQQPSKP